MAKKVDLHQAFFWSRERPINKRGGISGADHFGFTIRVASAHGFRQRTLY